MKNSDVIKRFINKEIGATPTREINKNGWYSCYSWIGNTLTSTGDKLINYNTVIAYWKKDKLYINIKKYSNTTSKIQTEIKRQATNNNIKYMEVLGC